MDVTASDLSALVLPESAQRWIAAADPVVEIMGHAIGVDLDWWNVSLRERNLAGGPVTGFDTDGEVVTSGKCIITRGHVFDQAVGASEDPDAALRLLWHALAWGSGSGNRNNTKRMDAVAADSAGSGAVLTAAAYVCGFYPVEAYDRLYPGGRTSISSLGPAFFTKFLYFAGGGASTHPCLILDRRVAASLIQIGWTSLHPDHGWPANTYDRYLQLMSRWRDELADSRPDSGPRLDLLERWLYNNDPAAAQDGAGVVGSGCLEHEECRSPL